MTPEPVIIVSGLPRSGTSMMMQMLEAGGLPILADHVRRADDDNSRGYYEFEPVKKTRTDPSWLQAAPGKAVKLVYLLLYDLPPTYQYRVIFMRRALGEVIASQRAMLRRMAQSGSSLPDAQLMAAYEKELEKVSKWLAAQANFTVLDVPYRDAVIDPVSQARAIDTFLGGWLDVAAMGDAVKPVLHRQKS